MHKKGIFCRTESVATTPKSRDHMPTTSLWGVAAKWPTRAPGEDETDTLPKRPLRIQTYQFESARQDFEGVPVFHGVCEIALTEVLATQMGVMRRSKKVSSFELYKFNQLSLGSQCGCHLRFFSKLCMRVVDKKVNYADLLCCREL